VVHGDQLALDVRADAHLAGGSQQNANLAVAHLLEQLGLLVVVLGVVNERDLLGRDALRDQAGLDVLVEVELADQQGLGLELGLVDLLGLGVLRMVVCDRISKIRSYPPAKNIPEDTNIDGVA
jgi:hypothetical protein